MRKRTPLSKFMVFFGVLFSSMQLGCAGFGPRTQGPVIDQVTVTFQTVGHEGDLHENQWLKICEVLERYGMVGCADYERTRCKQVGSVRVCDFENVNLSFAPPLSLKRLTQFHDDLIALKSQGVALGLTRATFEGTYASLTAEGMISIRVRIAVTPGATLYLERRWAGVCEKVLTPENVFNDEITLRPGQKWIYYRTELGAGNGQIRRFFRLNVSSRESEELTNEEFDRLIRQP